MNKKYLLLAKNLFWQYYLYLIVAIFLAYNAYICYFITVNLNLAYQTEENAAKGQVAINTTLYEKIVEQKKAKQTPPDIATNKNPFSP